MASVRQWQRLAIERLRSEAQELNLGQLPELFLGNDRLFPLGVSNGVGTCSQVHGMNVLVVGLTPPHPGVEPVCDATGCAYAVLLRWATEEEKRESEYCNSALDLLRVKKNEQGRVVLEKAGATSLYCATI